MTFLSVDIGRNIGYALFDTAKVLPVLTGHYKEDDMQKSCDKFSTLLKKLKPNYVIMEDAVFLGQRTRASNTHFIDLCKLVGMYMAICNTLKIRYRLIPVTKWKGQLTQAVVKKWIQQDFNIPLKNVHITSAVGMGLFEKGLF